MSGKSKPAATYSSQSTTQNPYGPSQEHLNGILGDAQRLFNENVGGVVYGGPRVAGFGGTTTDAISRIKQSAAEGPSSEVRGGLNYASGILSNGGMTQGERGALDGMRGLLGDYRTDPTAQGIASAPGSVETNLDGVARGDYLGGANPFLDALINQSADTAATNVASRFSGAGRYGSGAFSRAIADATGRIATQTRFDDYNNERQRQAQTAQLIDASRMGRAGLSLQQQQQDFSNRSGALGNVLQGEQGARSQTQGLLGQLGALEALRDAPSQRLLAVGQMEDAQRQEEIDAARQQFDETQRAPWERLGLYQSAVMPIAGAGQSTSGTSMGTQQQAQASGLQQGVGGALASAGTLATLAKSLPAVISLFSDKDAKEDIRPVGKLDDGQKVYSYRYKGEPQTHIGLLAQEVAEHEPDAVMRDGGTGLLMVDYAKATRRAMRAA